MTSWGQVEIDGLIRVMVVDDDESVRRALARIINNSPVLTLVGVAADGEEAIRMGGLTHPDVALVDVSMPGGGGVVVAEALRLSSPQTKVLALSGSVERSGVMEMLAAGALGYLVKGADLDLVAAVQAASRGQGVLTSEIAADVIGELSERLVRQKDEEKERATGISRIEEALDGGIEMVFQPVLDLQKEAVVGYEALARFLLTPRRTPDRWFAEAWAVGLGYELEVSALEAALDAGLPGGDGFLAVNLSPGALVDPRFLPFLDRSSELDRLVVEITEHAVVEDYELLNRSLGELRQRQVRVAVDDAGAGYASLRHVLILRPDFIKLDGSLITGIHADPAKRAVAVGMISSAHELGAEVVAEAIEQAEELSCVARLGANLGQGYHLGRPAPLVRRDAVL
jgi:EAL domain-containing protein (putative c-di-GMP-specific phosphodiesterase class I)